LQKDNETVGRRVFWGVVLTGPLLAFSAPALADPADWTANWSLAPFQASVGDAQLDMGALASGAVFGGTATHQNASGVLKLMPRLHRDYDSGLSIGLNATLTASAPLSRGRYNGDFVEKAYGEIRTGLGRVEIGQTDGAAYALALGGPKVDDQVSLDNPQTSFFRDPSTGRAFTDAFALRTQIGASSNDAKFAYVSPALFGAQLALSFTPNMAKDGLPFLHAGPHVPGRQAAIWEAGLRYSADVGPVTLSSYAGGAFGRAEHKLPGQEGVSDIGAGLRADYPVNDDVSLSLGGAYRQSNAHAFDPVQSWQGATTNAASLSASLINGSWIFGVEAGNGAADKVAALPRLGLHGYQASVGYVVNSGMQLTAGWQRLTYNRSSGAFYNGGPRIAMDAAFLHLNLHTSP
jgi:hypothetical protein